MLNERDLKIFLELCATLNISRAAERIGLTQPALSQWMKKVESELQMILFLRTKKGITLTSSGRKLEQKSKEMLMNWENFLQSIKADDEALKGIFKFGIHSGVALYALPKIFHSLKKNTPNIELNLKHELSRILTEEVISNKLDLALVMNPIRHPDLVIIPILKDSMHLWSINQNANAKEIETLIYNPNLIQAQYLIRKLKTAKIKINHFIETDSFEVALGLANAGIGTCIAPELIAKELGNKKLLPFLKNQFKYSDELCLVYKAGFQKSNVAKALIAEIKQSLS